MWVLLGGFKSNSEQWHSLAVWRQSWAFSSFQFLTQALLLLHPTRDSCHQLWIMWTDVRAHGSLIAPKDRET